MSWIALAWGIIKAAAPVVLKMFGVKVDGDAPAAPDPVAVAHDQGVDQGKTIVQKDNANASLGEVERAAEGAAARQSGDAADPDRLRVADTKSVRPFDPNAVE
jgi:hypothetical protein